MNCQNLFSRQSKKNYFNMSSAENFTQHAQRLKSEHVTITAFTLFNCERTQLNNCINTLNKYLNRFTFGECQNTYELFNLYHCLGKFS